MLSQKPEAQCVHVCVCVRKSAAEVSRVKNKIKKKKKKDDYSTALTRIFVHKQQGHATGKMYKRRKMADPTLTEL